MSLTPALEPADLGPTAIVKSREQLARAIEDAFAPYRAILEYASERITQLERLLDVEARKRL